MSGAARGWGELQAQRVFDALVKYRAERGYSPSIRELCDLVGFSSPSSAWGYLKRLKAAGRIDYDERYPRTARPLTTIPA